MQSISKWYQIILCKFFRDIDAFKENPEKKEQFEKVNEYKSTIEDFINT